MNGEHGSKNLSTEPVNTSVQKYDKIYVVLFMLENKFKRYDQEHMDNEKQDLLRNAGLWYPMMLFAPQNLTAFPGKEL